MNFRSLLALVICIFIRLVSLSQTSDTIDLSHKADYIVSTNELMNVKLSMTNNLSGFVVDNTSRLNIYPNNETLLRFHLNYRWLSFSYSLSPDFLPGNGDDDTRGSTKVSRYNFNLNFNHWMQHFSYSRVKGYYLDNTKDFQVNWQEGDPYIQFPDLVYKSLTGTTAYKFNRNFSFNAISTQSERQKRSTGSFIPSLTYTYYIVDDKTPLTVQNTSQKSNNFEVIVAPGYVHTFVFADYFYATLGAHAGIGLLHTRLTTRSSSESIRSNYNSPVYRFDGMTGLGYNSDQYFFGANLNFTDVGYRQNKTDNVVVQEDVMYEVFFGIKLNVPKKLKVGINKIEQKVARYAVTKQDRGAAKRKN